MDLRHIGSKDTLLCLETERLSVTIKGPPPQPDLPGIACDDESTLLVRCAEDFSVALAGNPSVVSSSEAGNVYRGAVQAEPVFFEQKQYEIFAEPSEGHTVSFWHDNYALRNAVTPVGRKQQMLSGVINFRNNIGLSDFVFYLDGKEYLTLTLEVYPSKISYKKDYQAIVADVTCEIYSLIFDLLKKTYSSFDTSDSAQSSPVEFYAIIRKIYEDYISAADLILHSPHHELQKTREILPQHKIRRAGKETLKWLSSHPEHVLRDGHGNFQAEKALTTRKFVSYDTHENRLMKYMLMQTIQKLEHFRHTYMKMKDTLDEGTVSQIDAMIQGLQRRCNTGFLQIVPAQPSDSGMSLVFGMAPGYQELYRCFLLMQHGLTLTGGIFHISVKDLPLLYEYWCFIKLNSLMKSKYRLISQDVIQLNGSGLTVSLMHGKASRIRYDDEKTGDQITLSYNPSERNLPTVSQRPDNVLSLTKKGSRTRYEYIFDAKYKIDPSLKGTYYHEVVSGLPGPKEEDINTMHRYRDAIVSEQEHCRYERSMVGAYVLFPYANEEEYKQHRFYKSIEKVNIGGLPFLPSATSLVSSFLDDLIADSPESAFERTSLPQGIEEKLAKVDWQRKDILIGGMREAAHLSVFLEENFYCLPVSSLTEDHLPVRFVALYQSVSLFGNNAKIAYYGEVKQIQTMKRWEITRLPCTDDQMNEDYYRFAIREWKMLARPIEVRERGIKHVAFTNEFLFRHSESISELFLKTPEEYRFLMELKRYVHNGMIINDNDAPASFLFSGYRVLFQDGAIKLTGDNGFITECTIQDFQRHPHAVFRSLMQHIAADGAG